MGQQLIKARIMKYERNGRNFFDTRLGKLLLIIIDYFFFKDFIGFGKTCFVFKRKVSFEFSYNLLKFEKNCPISEIDSTIQAHASSITIIYITSRVDANRIIKIASRFCHNIRSINIINCRGSKMLGAVLPGKTEGIDMLFRPISFCGDMRECLKLDTIQIVACEVDNSIKEFMRSHGENGKLRTLILKQVTYRLYHVKDTHTPMIEALSNGIIGNAKPLKTLKIHLKYDDVELSDVIAKCKNLQKLSLGFPKWSEEMLNKLPLMLKNLSSLSYLTLLDIDVTKTYDYFKLPNLSVKKVKLTGIGNIAHLVKLLAKKCKTLEHLTLKEYRAIESGGTLCTAENIKKLIKRCPKLTKMIISPIDYEEGKKLDGYLKKAKKLDMVVLYQTSKVLDGLKWMKKLDEQTKSTPDVLEDFKIPKLEDKYISDYHVVVTAYVRALKKGKPHMYKIVERISK